MGYIHQGQTGCHSWRLCIQQNTILLPVFAQILLTFGIGIWMARLRFRAVRQGNLNPRYYELNRGGKLPDYLARVSHNYDNLLALPVLFYVVCILLLVTHRAETAQIILAWVFVASRYLHSYIHTTYNRVAHRMRAFMVGVASLMAMWLLFFVRMI